jgi:hypothetical protein
VKTVSAVMLEKAEVLRWSSIKKRLHDRGHDDVAEELDEEVLSAVCSIHGRIHDPIVAILVEEEEIAVICPLCQNKEIQAQYVAEGRIGSC